MVSGTKAQLHVAIHSKEFTCSSNKTGLFTTEKNFRTSQQAAELEFIKDFYKDLKHGG